MATFECPRCGFNWTGTDAGFCPACRGASKSTRTRVLRARPHNPPPSWVTTAPDEPAEPQPRSRRLLASIAAVFGIISLLGGICWQSLRPQASSAPEPIHQTAIPDSEIVRPPISFEPLQPRRPTPKVRVVPTEALPEMVVSSSDRLRPSSVPIEQVDEALRAGISYLRAHPERWLKNNSYPLGYAALPGLALLEAGIDPADPVIAAAASRVRDLAPNGRKTYEVALAVLFLDRLGEPADVPLIRSLALRLVAAQGGQGGWSYDLPLLGELETALASALEKTRPSVLMEAPVAREDGKGLRELEVPLAGEKSSGQAKPLDASAEATRLVRELPERLRRLPIFAKSFGGDGPLVDGRRDDNSNTQFALLALWAARRHGVPVERSLLLADQRFARSQVRDGSWGYVVRGPGSPAMTCVGLLGLAVGHGALLGETRSHGTSIEDPAIRRGLEALARTVGEPDRPGRSPNLYTLWSIERVAMLYGLSTLGGKDWYGWGANFLIKEQRSDGGWLVGGYPGSDAPLDTAFALLFLRRSNLVQDLTDRLQLHMAISDRTRARPE